MVCREDLVKFDPDNLLLEGINATDKASTPQAWSPGGVLLLSVPALQIVLMVTSYVSLYPFSWVWQRRG